jgi:hypothetical protein
MSADQRRRYAVEIDVLTTVSVYCLGRQAYTVYPCSLLRIMGTHTEDFTLLQFFACKFNLVQRTVQSL